MDAKSSGIPIRLIAVITGYIISDYGFQPSRFKILINLSCYLILVFSREVSFRASGVLPVAKNL